MADPGVVYSEKTLKKVEGQITKVYSEAQKDIQHEMDDFVSKYSSKEAVMKEKLKKGEISPKEFSDWQKGQLFQTKQFAVKKKQVTDVLTNANKNAMQIVNGGTIDVFAENCNYESFAIEQGFGVNFGFGLVDANTMTKLIKEQPKLLPLKTLNVPKDKAWNQKKITNCVTQGILQGESIDKIASRIAKVTTSQNRNSMMMNARTATTGAQNAGREQSMKHAAELGINIEKEWMATLDNRTRTSHAHLDGEKIKVGDKWHHYTFSNGCRFPGDPQGPGWEVYNCRCTLVTNFLDYPDDYERRDNINGEVIKNMTYDEWKKSKKQASVLAGLGTLEDAKEVLANLQKTAQQLDIDEKFEGIWKDPVGYKDWENVKDSIPAKKQYFENKIAQFEKKGVNYSAFGGEEGYNIFKKANSVYSISWDDMNKLNNLGVDMSNQNLEKLFKMAHLSDNDFAMLGGKKGYNILMKASSPNDVWNDFDSLQFFSNVFHGTSYDQIEELYNLVHDPYGTSLNINKFKSLLQDLEVYELNGPNMYKILQDIDNAKDTVKLLTPQKPLGAQFAADAWDDATKSMAKSFTDRYKADQYHRAYLDSIWDDLDDSEKFAVWRYTENSHPMNKSLSGYHDDWDRSSFIGLENADWGHEDSWRSFSYRELQPYLDNGHVNHKRAITDLTKGIEKSEFQDGVMLVRGSDKNGLAGLIEGDLFSYEDAESILYGPEQELKDAFVGQTFQNHSFMSTGIARGTGFSGDVKYNIYAPAGTKAIYAEPASYFGDTVSMNGRLYQKGESYRGVSGEAEVILQRGTEFRITDIRKSQWGDIEVDMEVVRQPDYFKYGDEDTFNNGATRHKS